MENSRDAGGCVRKDEIGTRCLAHGQQPSPPQNIAKLGTSAWLESSGSTPEEAMPGQTAGACLYICDDYTG